MKNVLIYTTHKSASMFLHELATTIAAELEIEPYSINNNQYFDAIKAQSWKGFIEDPDKQGCFGPIRSGETNAIFPDNPSDYSIVLHLRDPRDTLTSLFFSHVYSHPSRKGGFDPGDSARQEWEEMGIDAYVLDKVPKIKRRYQLLTENLLENGVAPDNVQLVRYRDMVLDYPKWLDQFLAAFSHIEVPSKRLLKVIGKPNSLADIRHRLVKKYQDDFKPPKEEDVFKHKRQIIPGDYARKLKASTIETLNSEFSDVLKVLDLIPETQTASSRS